MRTIAVLLVLMFVCVGIAFAAPTTNAATGVTTRTVTFNKAGGATDCWFEWGGQNNLIYHTINDTACGNSYTVTGAPLLTSTVYYVRACDTSGCGSTVSFTTPAASVSNRTHYGDGLISIWRSGFNVSEVLPIIFRPYTSSAGGGDVGGAVIGGLLCFAIFVGYWIRSRNVMIPTILALISGGVLNSGGFIGLGIPPEFQSIGLGIMIVGVAGIFYSIFTR